MNSLKALLGHDAPATNPYVIGAKLAAKRLAWDLVPESWRSRRRLAAMQGKHAGEKAVILCNGPSLLKTDFDLLEDCFVIGLNKINLLLESRSFRLDAIVAVNALVIEQNADFYNATDIPLFLDSHGRHKVRARENVSYLHAAGYPRFARDVSTSVYTGATVTFVAMQLAFHLGFQRVALVGCDHNFAVKGPANKTVESTEKDESHFDPRYFAGGVKWQLPDLLQSEIAYLLALEAYGNAGRELVNATEGGKLELLPRTTLPKFLGEA